MRNVSERLEMWAWYGQLLRVWEGCKGVRDTPMSDMSTSDFMAMGRGYMAQEDAARRGK